MLAEVLAPPYPADTQAKGWRFELDYEQIDQSDTWDLAAEVPMGQPALLMMWLVAWRQKPCGSLPADEAVIRSKCRIPQATWAKCRAVCMRGWWIASDGRLYHDTIVRRVLAMLVKREKDAGRTAARRARNAVVDVSHPEVVGVSRVTPDGLTGEFDTKHQAPSTSNQEPVGSLAARKARGSRRCPVEFEVSAEMREWAEATVPRVDIDRETLKLRNFEFKTARKDWPATWQNWLLSADERLLGGGAPTESFHAQDLRSKQQAVLEATGGLLSPQRRQAPQPLEEVFDVTPSLLG
jgi:hypothetical protein